VKRPAAADPKSSSHRANGDGLLDLSKLAAPSDYISIDGETFDLAAVDAFSLIQRAQMNALIERVGKLQDLPEPTEEESREFEMKLRELAAIALPKAPPAKLATLNVGQLLDLAFAFFVWVGERSPRPTLLRRIGARSSPGSSGSTAETR
jgi:hypothetical protein